MHSLSNSVRDYAWGSPALIPGLTGEAPTGRPQAEMWIGAHPSAPSVLSTPAGDVPLTEHITRDPEGVLGKDAAARFGALPFLTKLLAADAPLSLQVHPNIEQARAGFDAENAAGIPLDAPHRNYKDRNHKPEMVIALTDFDALSGFRDPTETAEMLRAVLGLLDGFDDAAAALSDILEALEAHGLREAFGVALTGDRSRPGAAELPGALESCGALTHEATRRWAAELQTALDLSGHYPGDPGILVSLLVNRVRLSPGESIYLPAGNLHAYLGGFGVEVMATSDNVLRGGLTPKHVDIEELTRTLVFEALPVPRCVPQTEAIEAGISERFRPPFEEFSVEKLTFERTGTVTPEIVGASIVLVTAGAAELRSPTSTVPEPGDSHDSLRLAPGQTAFHGANEGPLTIAADAGTVVFVVTGARAHG